ncbi:MAG: AEC family transporter [Archangium sp.]
MANLVLLVLCFLVGLLARRSNAFPADSNRAINAWVMFVSLPALVFRAIHGVKLDATLLVGAASLWLVFIVPAVVVVVLVKRGAPVGPLGAVVLCAGCGNTAFVGLPLIEALGGKEALGPASVVDQLGTFVALFLFAIPFASWLSGANAGAGVVARRVLKAPALWALVLALVLADIEVPAALDTVLARLGDMLSPLALATVGWALDVKSLRGNGARIFVGLSWKLVLAPAMVLAILYAWRGAVGPTERIIVAQAAMAPMVTAGVVAADNSLEPGLASALIAVGVPLSLLSVPIWWHALS